MNNIINSVNLIYYSPTGTSRKIAHAIGDGLKVNNLKESDITFGNNLIESSPKDSLTVIVSPVYGGRIPSIFFERLGTPNGNGAMCAVVAVYGNRHYDDALLELKDEMTKRGFRTVAAASFIGEHSFSRDNMPVAAGRPDHYDLGMAEHFGKEVMDKINTVPDFGDLWVPGNHPYKEIKPKQPVAPVSTDSCCSCGLCVSSCPTHAISLDQSGNIHTDIDKCTLCCACVKVCPQGARVFDTPFTKFLFDNFSERKNPEFYF